MTTPRAVIELDIPADAVTRLRGLGLDVTQVPHHHGDWEFAPLALPCPEILLCKRPPRDIAGMPGLKWVQIGTVGYEHLKGRGLADSPVVLTNARGVFDTAIGEWCVGMMVALMRDLRQMLRDQGHGVWRREARYQQQVRGRTVGLWGYGGIGREVARLARALGAAVHVLTRHGVGPRHDAFTPAGTGDPDGTLPHRGFGEGERNSFLASLDFLVLALPHTRESDGMVGPKELAALRRGAFLLNPARGPIIQETALLDALRKGHLGGAALDTHFAYPLPADHPLWRFPNVILTPHIAGADGSRDFPGRIAELFEANARRWLAGETLLNVISRREWLEA
jgi:phosphoglycerate dehydrogenase-like enzyme